MASSSFVHASTRRLLEKHVLTEVPALVAGTRIFYLHPPDVTLRGTRPGRRMLTTCFIFSPEGIVIVGDVSVRSCKNGVISDFGYGLEWFAGQLGEDYLCEKFLRRVWHPYHALEYLKSVRDDQVADLARDDFEGDRDEKNEVVDQLNISIARGTSDDDLAQEEFYELLAAIQHDPEGGGYGYSPDEADLLCALQQRFSAAYALLPQETEKRGEETLKTIERSDLEEMFLLLLRNNELGTQNLERVVSLLDEAQKTIKSLEDNLKTVQQSAEALGAV
jgi:hypothetical protein